MVTGPDRSKFFSTDLLRFIAIVLIVNSHLDDLYPVSGFATGGAIGNSFFFMLSGYGIALGYKKSPSGFGRWYLKRILRIYPSLVIAVLLFVFLSGKGLQNWQFTDYMKNFIWPTEFWFISALMLFYIILYGLMRLNRQSAYITTMGLLLLVYLSFYIAYVDLSRYSIEGPGYFKWIFYLQIMLFGGYLSGMASRSQLSAGMSVAVLGAALIIYHALLLIINMGYGTSVQALTHLLMFPIVYAALCLAQSDYVSEMPLKMPNVSAVITFISALTLEIYLVHGYFHSHSLILSFVFPVNLAIFLSVILALSVLLYHTAGLFRRFVQMGFSSNI